MKDEGGSTFPTTEHMSDHRKGIVRTKGMSLRDYFAGQALQGILSNPDSRLVNASMEDIAMLSYIHADQMLAARKKNKLRGNIRLF